MKTIADFKRKLKTGVLVHTIFKYLAYENKEIVEKVEDRGIREIGKVMSKQFTLVTKRSSGKVEDSYCSYPQTKDVEFPDKNTIVIFEDVRMGASEIRVPVLTYTFITRETFHNAVYEAYREKGMAAAFDEANKYPGVTYRHCPGCMTKVPVFKHDDTCPICGQDVEPHMD